MAILKLASAAGRDIVSALKMTPNVAMLAWIDMEDRYRRSALGPLWMALTLGVTAGSLGFLYSKILRQPINEYLPFITATLFIWLFFVNVINEATAAFVAGGPMIKNSTQPLFINIMRVIIRNVIVNIHTLPVLIFVLIYFQFLAKVNIPLFLFGYVIMIINLIWISMVIGLLSARYRDVPYVVSYVLQFFMFVSPIFWNPTMLEKGGWFVDWNPIYHWIAVVRDPILGASSTPASLWFCIATAVIGMGVAFAAFAANRSKVAFWV
jgi:ABC-type polysaccharide/polyol phosphate export permease